MRSHANTRLGTAVRGHWERVFVDDPPTIERMFDAGGGQEVHLVGSCERM